MSDTLLSLLAQPQNLDPYKPQAELAQVNQTNTATQGQQLANQQTAMQLAYRQALMAPILGQQGGGGSPLASLVSSPGSGGSGFSGALAAMAGQGGSAQGGAPVVGNSVMSPAGIPLPPMVYASAAMSQNPDAAFKAAADMRYARLHELATGPTNAGDWDANVVTALQEGWITPQQAAQWHGNYQSQARVQQSTASPDAQLSYNSSLTGQGLQSDANGNPMPSAAVAQAKGNIAGSEANARNQSDLTYKAAIDTSENGPLVDRAVSTARGTLPIDVTKQQASSYNLGPGETRINPAIPGATNADGTNQPPRAVDLLNTGAIPPSAYAARVNGAENSTGNPAAKNPNSSATGNGQFTESTWLSTIRQARPDLAGQSDQQLLALRSVPAIAAQMTAAYGQQNAGVLQQAGLPVTSATLGMAHRLGPADAITVMNADPQKPLAAVLSGDVIARNPDLARQTAGSFVNGSMSKYGNQPVAFAQPAVATRPAAPPSPGRSPAGGVSPFGSDQTSAAQPVASSPGVTLAAAPAGAAVGNPAAPIQHADERFPAGGASLTNAANGEFPGVAPAPSLPPGQGYAPAGALSPNTPVPGGQPQTVAPPAPPAPMAAPPVPAPSGGPLVTQLPGGGTAVQSGITPALIAQQRAQAENDVTQMGTYRTGLLTDAQKAAQSNSLIDTMRTEAQQFSQGGGANADWRDMQATMNNWSNLFGGSPFPAVSNVEAFNKAAGQLVREAASTVSPRVGVQELQMVQKTLLSDDTSPQGFQKIADQLQGIADYRIAKSAAASQASGNPNAFEANWNAHVTPLAFIVNRMPTADAQQLAVQLNKTEQGKRTLGGIMQQMQYADQTGLFRAVQP